MDTNDTSVSEATEAPAAAVETTEAPESVDIDLADIDAQAIAAMSEGEEVPAEEAPAPATEETKVEAKPERASGKLAKLIEREKAAEAREAELVQAAERLKAYEAAIEGAKANPRQLLEKLGVDFAAIVQAYAEDEETAKPEEEAPLPPAIKKALEKIEAFEKAQADSATKAQEAAQERAVQAHQHALAATIAANKEKFELASLEDPDGSLAMEVTRLHYEKTQEILPLDKALEAVEAHLEEKARRLTSAKKLQAKPTLATALAANKGVTTRPVTRTLSNNLTSPGPRAARVTPDDPSEVDKMLTSDPEFRLWGN